MIVNKTWWSLLPNLATGSFKGLLTTDVLRLVKHIEINVAEPSINIELLPSSSSLSGVWPMGPTAVASQTDPTLFLKVPNSHYFTGSTQTCFDISLLLQDLLPLNLCDSSSVDTGGLCSPPCLTALLIHFPNKLPPPTHPPPSAPITLFMSVCSWWRFHRMSNWNFKSILSSAHYSGLHATCT